MKKIAKFSSSRFSHPSFHSTNISAATILFSHFLKYLEAKRELCFLGEAIKGGLASTRIFFSSSLPLTPLLLSLSLSLLLLLHCKLSIGVVKIELIGQEFNIPVSETPRRNPGQLDFPISSDSPNIFSSFFEKSFPISLLTNLIKNPSAFGQFEQKFAIIVARQKSQS